MNMSCDREGLRAVGGVVGGGGPVRVRRCRLLRLHPHMGVKMFILSTV
jgi:hypothetical protein